MRVIGTAGHVDHGKSALIEALTGTHPDRLHEEQTRGLTIVLGFAWLTLPNGDDVGIVDVPGHRDFIENMLSGVGAIDAALFVVAADEGVMPQTREHLAILDLLQIQGGVIVLSKVDLIDDPDWLDLVEAEVRETLAGTVLDSAPLVRVSAHRGDGLPELLAALEGVLAERPPRPDLGRPRLSADRVFTVAGFGTVVTGTLTDGQINVGDEVEILPQGMRGRIRGLQTHKKKNQLAVPGSRTAINISGVDVDQIQRGNVIAHPSDYKPTRRLDVSIRLLDEISQPVRHNTEVKLFIGAAEVIARLRLLGSDVLNPGEEGWLQLELTESVAAMRGDRYILRRPSPGETLGGGAVIDPHPKGRHKRFDQKILDRFEALAGGTPADVLLQALLPLGAAPFKDVLARASLEQLAVAEAWNELLADGLALTLGSDPLQNGSILVTSQSYWGQISQRALREVDAYHQNFPLRHGVPREELKSRLKVTARIFDALLNDLTNTGQLAEQALRADLPGSSVQPVVKRPTHSVEFSSQQQINIDALLRNFKVQPHTPPSVKECVEAVGEEIYIAMVDLGKLIPLNGEVVFRWEDYQKMVAEVRSILARQDEISVAQVRDHFNTTRRYVLAFMEHLDAIGVTIRVGDVRKLKV